MFFSNLVAVHYVTFPLYAAQQEWSLDTVLLGLIYIQPWADVLHNGAVDRYSIRACMAWQRSSKHDTKVFQVLQWVALRFLEYLVGVVSMVL